jgi:protein ImuB
VGGLTRYACLWVPHFAAVALVRSDPGLRSRPLAVLEGTESTRTVCDTSAEAWAAGVRPGMSAGEATTRVPGLVRRERSLEAERSAAAALLELALATSPRVEVAAPDRVHLDLGGLDGLFGGEPAVAERLALGARSLELPARVGVASSRTAAWLAIRATPGVVVVPAGREAAALAPLPVGLLDPLPELTVALARWGIRTLGELAALPPAGVLTRLGRDGAGLRARARGEDAGPFVPTAEPVPCVEAVALDWDVTALDALVFVLRPLLERLATRLAVREEGAAALVLTCGLADGTTHRRRLAVTAPLREPRTWLALVRADLDGLTLPAPVGSVAVEAEPAPLVPLQPDLFEPKRPSPHELARTLGQLVALVGADRVGAPVVGDSHCPGAVGVAPFTGMIARKAAVAALTLGDAATLTCRRLSPPVPATVRLRDQEPRSVEAPGLRGGPVVASAGPWRTAGEWWAETAWSREEWDVALPDSTVYRLALDRATGAWVVDAVYD